MARQGFVVYHDAIAQLDILTDEEFRALFLALSRYSETGELVEVPRAARIAFGFMSRSIDADEARYKRRCESGRKAVTARWNRTNTNDTDVCERIATNEPYTDDTNTNSNPNSNPNTKTKTKLSLSIDNSNAPVRDDDNDDLNGDLIEYITTNIGPLTSGNRAALREVMAGGMSADMIRAAVDAANAQNAHSMAYVMKVLESWIKAGHRTPEDVKLAEAKRMRGRVDSLGSWDIAGRTIV